jgi:hypothetical protein
MWTCPKCDARFVTRNLPHSCVKRSVEEFLADKPERGVELYRVFLREYRLIGDVLEHAVKTRVALMVDVRFASVNKIREDHIDGHLWLKQRVESPKFYRVDHLDGDDHIHHFRVSDESQIDDEFRSYMKLAYAIGCREHLKRGAKT